LPRLPLEEKGGVEINTKGGGKRDIGEGGKKALIQPCPNLDILHRRSKQMTQGLRWSNQSGGFISLYGGRGGQKEKTLSQHSYDEWKKKEEGRKESVSVFQERSFYQVSGGKVRGRSTTTDLSVALYDRKHQKRIGTFLQECDNAAEGKGGNKFRPEGEFGSRPIHAEEKPGMRKGAD